MVLPIFIAFAILLLFTVFPHSIVVPSRVGSALVVTGYAIFTVLVTIHLHNDGNLVRTVRAGLQTIYPIGLVCLSIIIALFVTHVLLGNYDTVTNAISGLIVPVIVVFNFVYVPRVIPADLFLRIVAVIATLLTGVGAAIYIAVTAAIIPVPALWPYPVMVPIAGIEVYPLASIMNNPNPFGQITFAGAIASLVLFDRDDRTVYGVFMIVIVLGLLASFSRASIFSATVAFAVYVAYTRGGRRVLLLTLALLAILLGGGLALIPVLSRLGFQISFTGRIPLWSATIQAITQQPVLGYGLGETNEMIDSFVDQSLLTQYGPHNSYLRMALHLGILGGIGYLVLFGWAFLKHFRSERIDIAYVALGVGFVVNQLFEEYTMFDPTAVSIIMTIVLGYLIVETGHSSRGRLHRRPRRRSRRSRRGANSTSRRTVTAPSQPSSRDRVRGSAAFHRFPTSCDRTSPDSEDRERSWRVESKGK